MDFLIDLITEAAVRYLLVFPSSSQLGVTVLAAFACQGLGSLVSLCDFFPSAGLFCGGLLSVQLPCDVRVGAGSQHPLLQEEVPGVGQVC